jgi:hypothetical protein
VLQAEPEVARIRKPPVYSNKLQVSEAHQARIALLEELIASEGKAKPVPLRAMISSQYALRLVIAVVLIAAVAWALLWNPGQQVPLPTGVNIPDEVKAVNGYINGLNNSAPVLLAIEYEPALSGEMDQVAVEVVRHLEDKGAHLTLVSTSPTGTALGARLLGLIESQTTISYTNVTHIGYIPGGVTGLRSFANDPRQMILYPLMAKAGSEKALANIETLADFALIMVLTDNSDTDRAWIEQVQPGLGQTPLVMVVSAQAAPMIRPYYPLQVNGMVVGLAGGAAYQSLRANQGLSFPPLKAWDAFDAGLLAVVTLVSMSGLINLFSAVWARSKGQRGEA